MRAMYYYGRTMTLKKRIYFSNTRIVLITIISFILIPLVIRVAAYLSTGYPATPPEMHKRLPGGPPVSFWFVTLAFFVIIISIVNNFLTYRLIKNIARPLEVLGEGIREVQKYNLSYRIDYQNDDEFRPVCDTFNQMTAYLEAAAVQQRKDEANRRELIAGISHDLRTPLTSIKGYLEGLETGVASTPAMREKYFVTIKNKTADLEHIIEQLFLFSKLDMDEFPLNIRRVSIVPVMRDIVEELAFEYAPRGLDIHFSAAPELSAPEEAIVSADTMWLRNVILNIVENSRVYKTTERGRVDISAVSGEGLTLRFTDDGPGVNAEALDKLFSAFYRMDPSRDKKGSGLGLAISAKVIERMGGTCRAELPVEGGLAIVITLPLAKDPA